MGQRYGAAGVGSVQIPIVNKLRLAEQFKADVHRPLRTRQTFVESWVGFVADFQTNTIKYGEVHRYSTLK